MNIQRTPLCTENDTLIAMAVTHSLAAKNILQSVPPRRILSWSLNRLERVTPGTWPEYITCLTIFDFQGPLCQIGRVGRRRSSHPDHQRRIREYRNALQGSCWLSKKFLLDASSPTHRSHEHRTPHSASILTFAVVGVASPLTIKTSRFSWTHGFVDFSASK